MPPQFTNFGYQKLEFIDGRQGVPHLGLLRAIVPHFVLPPRQAEREINRVLDAVLNVFPSALAAAGATAATCRPVADCLAKQEKLIGVA